MLNHFRGKRATKEQKVQMGALAFGNRMIHAMALASGQVLRQKHGWTAEQAAEFVKDVSEQMRVNERGMAESRDAAAT